MNHSIEDEDVPTPFLLRRSTWLFGFAGLLVVSMGGCWYNGYNARNTVTKLVESRQYDAAWAALQAHSGSLDDCDRYDLQAELVRSDIRTDTLALRMADSLRVCRMPPATLLELVALGNLRISAHNPVMDSSARWMLQANAFSAASHCVKSDSGNKACRIYGFEALVGMEDTYAQVNWMDSTLARWPDDSVFMAMAEKARKANETAKLAAAAALAPVAAPDPKKAPKVAKEKQK